MGGSGGVHLYIEQGGKYWCAMEGGWGGEGGRAWWGKGGRVERGTGDAKYKENRERWCTSAIHRQGGSGALELCIVGRQRISGALDLNIEQQVG